ncbi:MAG: F0F1 ATP synthase subunit delta, partial [Patescibacteria group bacterium]
MKISPRYYAKQLISDVLRQPANKDKIIDCLWQQVLKNKHFVWRKRIVQEVNDVWHSLTQEHQILITTGRELNTQEQKGLVSSLKKSVPGEFTVEWQVKPHLLGGVVVVIDGERFDFSVKGKL